MYIIDIESSDPNKEFVLRGYFNYYHAITARHKTSNDDWGTLRHIQLTIIILLQMISGLILYQRIVQYIINKSVNIECPPRVCLQAQQLTTTQTHIMI